MAQSVARLVRNEKVRGSSPLSSTFFVPPLTRRDARCTCDFHACDSLAPGSGVPPLCAPGRSALQTSPIGRGSEVVQIKVRGRDRSVPHPRLHGCRINSARQPQARGRVSRSWMRRPSAMVVQARVRLKALACSWWPDSVTNNRASGVPISSHSSHERQDSVSNRNATGPSRFGALDLNPLGLRALHHQDRQWNLDEIPDTHGAQLRPAQPGPGIDQ
jgi:hypothetical protein